MAGVPLYDIVIPLFTKGLQTFSHILDKAEAQAKSQGHDPDAVFPSARLIEDQNPLTFQVHNATRTVKITLARLTGVETAPYEDDLKTFADLRARIADAVKLLEGVDAGAVNGRSEVEIELPVSGHDLIKVPVKDAALNQGVPNFFFYLNTGYSILRAKGVQVGKKDYINPFIGASP